MRIPESVIEAVRDRVDIVEVIGEYVALTKKGDRYWGLSPFTTEKTPSFSVSPDKGLYYCFSTSRGGTLITFIMEMEGVSFPEAVRTLARRGGIEVPEDGDGDESSSREPLLELYRRVSGSFHYLLVEHDDGLSARTYLEQRSVSEKTVEAFQLGFSPADPFWLYRFLRKRKYSDEFLAGCGLFTRRNPRRSLFCGRLMFPIFSRSGDVVAFGGRLLSGDGPKYLNSPNTSIFSKSWQLYGLFNSLKGIRTSNEFVLVEGYTDVLAMHQAGVHNSVAPLGTSFTSEQAQLLARHASRAVIVLDADEAGFNASLKASILCEQNGIQPNAAELPSGSDPAAILQSDGAEVLRQSTNSAISSLEYFIGAFSSRTQTDTPEGKELVLRQLFPYIESISSEVRREASLAFVADALELQRQSVVREFEKRNKPSKDRIVEDFKRPRENESLSDELYLMLAVAIHCEHFALVRTQLSVDDFDDRRARELFIALEEVFRSGEMTFAAVVERIEDDVLTGIVYERAARDEFSVNTESVVRDSVRTVKRTVLERRLRGVESRLRRSDLSLEEQRKLMQDKLHLDGELQKLKVVQHG